MQRLLSALDRMNRALPWSHTDAYAGLVLHQARKTQRGGGSSALDVGCGTGRLLRRLAECFPQAVGIEADAVTAGLAAAAVATFPAATVVNARFPVADGRRYDFVSMVAVLHHLPLADGIAAVREVVAPGGRLVIVGVYREARADALFSVISLLLNPLIGMILHPRPADRTLEQLRAPAMPASEPYREIRSALRAALPGVRVRRGFFWRYVATWQAPRT